MKINELYNDTSHTRSIILDTGKKLNIFFLSTFTFELGQCYIGSTTVFFIINKIHESFFNNALKNIKGITYKTPEKKKNLSIYVPEILSTLKSESGDLILVLSKTIDVLSLRDILLKEKLDQRHVAWIVNRLFMLGCFLHEQGVSFNSFSTDMLFISPEFHSVMLLGGWWYTGKLDEKLIGLNREIVNNLNPIVLRDKKIVQDIDIESIKYIGRKLLKGQVVPKVLTTFLDSVSGPSIVEEYNKWDSLLVEAYGPKKFIKLSITESQLYK